MPRSALEFFREFVEPAYLAATRDPISRRLAVQALSELDNLAEHHANEMGLKPFDFRRRIAEEEPALQLAWDIHDVHKHGRLTRRSNATLSQEQLPEIVARGGFATTAYTDAAYAGETEELEIIDDAGNYHPLRNVIFRAFEFWRKELGL